MSIGYSSLSEIATALERLYDEQLNIQEPNAFESTFLEYLESLVPSFLNEFQNFIQNSEGLNGFNQEAFNKIFIDPPYIIEDDEHKKMFVKSYGAHKKMKNAQISHLISAFTVRIKFAHKLIFFNDNASYKEMQSDWLCNQLAPFITNMKELTVDIHIEDQIRDALNASSIAGKEEWKGKNQPMCYVDHYNNIVQPMIQYYWNPYVQMYMLYQPIVQY